MYKTVNSISLLLLIAIFILTPFSFMARVIILYSLFALWLFSSTLIDTSFLKQTIPLWLFILVFFILAYGKSTVNPDAPIERFIHTSFFTYIWPLFFIFYRNKLQSIRELLPFVLIMLVASCIFTIRGNLLYPGASRSLASISLSVQELRANAESSFVGGYGFVYSLCFFFVPIIHLIRNRKSIVLATITIISMYGAIITASYFLAIVLAVFLTVLSLSDRRNSLKTLFLLFFFSVVIVIFKDSLLQLLIDIGERIDSPMLSLRAEEVLNGSYQEEYDLTRDYSRIERLQNAVLNIYDSPLFGELGGLSSIKRPSGHSELLGYFESFGLLGFLYIIYFVYIYKLIARSIQGIHERYLFLVTYAFFLIFICINTFDVANSVGLAVFFLVPSMLQCSVLH